MHFLLEPGDSFSFYVRNNQHLQGIVEVTYAAGRVIIEYDKLDGGPVHELFDSAEEPKHTSVLNLFEVAGKAFPYGGIIKFYKDDRRIHGSMLGTGTVRGHVLVKWDSDPELRDVPAEAIESHAGEWTYRWDRVPPNADGSLVGAPLDPREEPEDRKPTRTPKMDPQVGATVRRLSRENQTQEGVVLSIREADDILVGWEQDSQRYERIARGRLEWVKSSVWRPETGTTRNNSFWRVHDEDFNEAV